MPQPSKSRRAASPRAAAAEEESFSLRPVHLDGFDGPLDLLLFLVKENKMDISRVSIASIGDQYLEFIYLMPLLAPLELENAADFLAVAALLAWMKSKSLLPVQEDDEENEEEVAATELLLRLKEYEHFAAPADWLWNRYRQFRLMFPRGISQPGSPGLDLGDVSLYDLTSAFRELLEKAKPEPPVEISRTKVNVEEAMKRILSLLRSSTGAVTLAELVGENPSRLSILGCFLALLELIKARKVRVLQPVPYGPISVALSQASKSTAAKARPADNGSLS
jgi:segregation and condensation protein A